MRYAAKIEYDGTHYHGWQYQNETLATVQLEVERALSKVANHFVRVNCAGRTDAGVHASGQIVHFESDAKRSARAWIFGSNANLPRDIVIHWVKQVPNDFHARFSAIARCYQYTIYNNPIRPAIFRHSVTWQCLPLDEALMQQAANSMLGEHDFSSFRASGCQAKSPIKTIEYINIHRQGDIITLHIKANAFLHHMVRNIAGTLMAIGAKKEAVSWVSELLKAKNRADGGTTAPAAGLTLTEISYNHLI